MVIACLPFIVYGAYTGARGNENVVTDWLPSHFEETKRLEWFKERFGTAEMLAISWEGCTLENERTKELAEALRAVDLPDGRQDSKLFAKVFSGPEMLDTLSGEPFNLSRARAIKRMQGWLVGPTGHTCVIAQLSKAGESFRHEAVDSVLDLTAATCDVDRAAVHLAGPSIDSVAIDRSSSETIQPLNLLCWSICLTVAAFSFRSFRIGVMIFFVALICQYLSVAIIYYSGTTMNSILMMVASLVFVLSVSASVHITNYYRDAIEEGGLAGAAGKAVRAGWAPCWLAAGTTSLGMASLMVSRIKPIFTFGEYAAIGVLAGLALLMLAMPAWLEWQPMRHWAGRPGLTGQKKSGERIPDGGIWNGWAHSVMRFHAWIVTFGLAGLVVAGFGISRIETTVNLHDMFRRGEQVIQDYDWMQQHIGPMVPVDVVLHIPLESEARMLERMQFVQRVRREIVQVESVGSTITAGTFAPKISAGGSVTHVIRRAIANRELEKHRESFQKQGFLVDDGEEELWRISVRVNAKTRVDYGEFLDRLEQQLAPVIQQQQSEPSGVVGVHATLCGGVPLVNKAQKQLLKDLAWSFATAFALVGVTMVLVLRDFMGGLLSMLPNIVPSVIVFGIMGWLDVVVDIGAMMTASAALGIAVDDTLHFITWFRRGLIQGYSRRTAVLNAFQRCGNAMTQTSIICGFGLLAYSLSPFIPVSRFGWIMFLMLFAALIGDLIFLPALLAGPLGRFFEVRQPKESKVGRDNVIGARIEVSDSDAQGIPVERR